MKKFFLRFWKKRRPDALFPNYKQTVLIVTLGRTGSTLLQGMLNSCENICIRGENFNFAVGIFNLYRHHYLKWREYASTQTRKTTSPWFGANELDPANFFESAREFFFRQLYPGGSDKRCLGFKEIRYLWMMRGEEPDKSLHELLDFYSLLFKNIKLLFLTREYSQIVQSSWWKNSDPEQLISRFQAFDAACARYAQLRPGCCFQVTYADLLENRTRVEHMFHFLGEKYDKAEIDRVLRVKHSY
ncbi:sulfotransferase [Desulfovibrio sp. OttesenSCG-928-A18]|nr:sulfotransferase [Desulfovibrio sp. OttesenSCG-928-A18]